jgi:hypothetical protein
MAIAIIAVPVPMILIIMCHMEQIMNPMLTPKTNLGV